MYYKCTKDNLRECVWRRNCKCTMEDEKSCKYSLAIHRAYSLLKEGTIEEIADIIQDYIDNYMSQNNINAYPPTVEEVEDWLREEA